MSVKLKRLTALLLSTIMVVGNAAPGFAAPLPASDPEPVKSVGAGMLISTEETVWRYLDDNTDPAETGETDSETPGDASPSEASPSEALPSDASPSEASALFGLFRSGTEKGSREAVRDRLVWTGEDYDDSGWKEDRGSFGAKKGAIADLGSGLIPHTLLNQYIDEPGVEKKTDIPAYFFRTTVEVEDVSEIEALNGEIFYDDAAIIYINGVEVHRAGVPEGGYSQNLEYGGTNAGTPINSKFQITDLSMLKEGSNTVAVELHQGRASSSDIYFDFCSLEAGTPASVTEPFKSISLGVGEDETKMGITWYSAIDGDGKVRIASAADMDGENFPEQASEFGAKRQETNVSGYFSFQAVIEGLEADTGYVYQVGAGEKWSDVYEFTTRDYENGFNFLLAGDPQIGAGSTAADIKGWQNTLKTAMDAFPETSFLISAGDQVNTASNEEQYTVQWVLVFCKYPFEFFT